MGLWRLSDASRSMSMHPSLRVIIDPQVLIADVSKIRGVISANYLR
jgi:hypothetical protein